MVRSITNLSGNKILSSSFNVPNNCIITNNGTLSLLGSIFGTGGILHAGTGITTLNNYNGYIGSTNIRSGTLKIGNSGTLGKGSYSGMMFINGVLDYSSSIDQIISGNVGNYSLLGSRYNPNSMLIVNGPGTFHVRSTFGDFQFDGTLEINGGKFRVGNNDLIPTSNSVYTGTGSIASIKNIFVNTNGTLEFNRNNSASQANVNAVITGNGPINILNGSYIVAGGGNYSGVLTIDSGTTWNMSRIMPNANFINNGTLTLNVGSSWNPNYVWNVTVNGNTTNTIYNTDYVVGTSIGGANITAQIQSAGFGNNASEFVGFVPGRIALVQRGGEIFQTKVTNAIAAGAVAVIIYNNTTGLVSPSVTTNIPVIMITQSLGQQLVSILSTDTVTSRIDTSSSSTPFNNSVTGNGTIIKSGDSPLTVSLGSGFTGIVSITGGVLRVLSSNGFGGVSSVRPTGTTGAVEILGGLTISNPFSLNGTGISSGGAIRNISDNNILSGGITLLAASRINSDAGILTVGSNVSGTFGLTVGGTGNTTINGILSNTTLTKDGAGMLELAAVNTYPNGTTISAGTLKLTGGGVAGTGTITNNSSLVIENNEDTTILNSIAGTGTLIKNLNTRVISAGSLTHTGTTTINSGTLALGSNASISGSTGNFVVNSGATLEISRSTNSTFARPFSGAGSLLISSSNTSIFTSNLTHTGGTTVSAGTLQIGNGSTTGSISGDIVNNAAVQFNRSDALSYAGIISGTGNLTKAAAGTLTLTGNNTYSGTTTISAGVLRVGHANALGSGTSTVSIPASTALELTGDVSFGRNLSSAGTGVSSGGSLRNVSGNNTFNGNFTQTAASRINSDAGTLTLSNSGTLTGTFGLTLGGAGSISVQRPIATSTGAVTKDGAGTVVLSAANTYTGVTTISGGTLLFTFVSSLYNGTTSSWTRTNIIVNTGATFAINVGGTNEFTTTNVGTLLTNLLTTINNNGLRSGSSIGFDTTNSTADFTISNNITNSAGTGSGAVGVVKLGTGTLVLTGTGNTYTGGTRINGGTLRAGNATCFGTGTITINNGATLDRAGLNITNTIINNGGLIIN